MLRPTVCRNGIVLQHVLGFPFCALLRRRTRICRMFELCRGLQLCGFMGKHFTERRKRGVLSGYRRRRCDRGLVEVWGEMGIWGQRRTEVVLLLMRGWDQSRPISGGREKRDGRRLDSKRRHRCKTGAGGGRCLTESQLQRCQLEAWRHQCSVDGIAKCFLNIYNR